MQVTCPCGAVRNTSTCCKDSSTSDGLAAHCRRCMNLKKSLCYRENKEKFQLREKIRYNNLSDAEKKARFRTAWLRLYNLTEPLVEQLLKEQEFSCAACRQVFGKDDETLPCVDHDHKCCSGVGSCGKCIRGLLCRKCNRLLGVIEKEFVLA